MDASLGTVNYRSPRPLRRVDRLMYACKGARRRRLPAVVRGCRRPAARGTHGRSAANPCSGWPTRSISLSVDRSRFVLDVVRALFTTGAGRRRHAAARSPAAALLATPATPGETVPLPLDASIWRETLLPRQVPDNQIIGAILSDRRPRFSITGSPASTTRRSRGSEPSARRCATASARRRVCGFRAERARAGRTDGRTRADAEAEPMWQAIVGADPAKPAAFVRRLFSDDRARWRGSTTRCRSSTNRGCDSPRAHRCRRRPASNECARCSTSSSASATSGNLKSSRSPAGRIDPALTLGDRAHRRGRQLSGPNQRGIWERVFADDSAGGRRRSRATPRDRSHSDRRGLARCPHPQGAS